MRKSVQGVLKNPGTTGPSALTTPYGYREPWKTGKASYSKRFQKITGPNWPST